MADRSQKPADSWSNPPEKLVLGANEVHLWRATVEVPAIDFLRFQRLLSSDERERSDRFHFERDRNRFVVARGLLRTILGSYLNLTPAELRFKYSEHGKPSLADCPGDLNLTFNLAHSGRLVLFGITIQRAIGVDVEEIRDEIDTERIARRFFSARETRCLLSIPEQDRKAAFFYCWTRKEAFLKANGAGLSLPLDQFDVSLYPGEPARLLETRWDENECPRWSLQAVDVGPAYAATVAVEGHDWESSYWQATCDGMSRKID